MLDSSLQLLKYYKSLGEKAIAQLDDRQLFEKVHDDANSIGNLVKHLWGNMLSRWTDFLTTDGEKPWRERDAEFEDTISDRKELLSKWEEGWQVVFDALSPLSTDDANRKVTIRGEEHTVEEAVLRQLAHYAYHIGQIVFIARNLKGENWESLSIPKGKSSSYNKAHAGKIRSSGESIWKK
ncbi:MAG: DUF1572 family protein [Saprospiraceae bacterium]|nr:DUF1572 family protein [Saprospiraceae bacterium]